MASVNCSLAAEPQLHRVVVLSQVLAVVHHRHVEDLQERQCQGKILATVMTC